ncbi:hypothetical protein NMK54_34335 [Nocardia otitidiscaviarum]|uniref:hypothetical protein n=1 Tax=Nocardia otitidiscaviarum TaxID=1823 RepID=UPI0020CE2B34|nr:hypothetical protein [Nocardia otitidiscaviarum]MCP9625226.1 hypothetical protein [Nocardia otitidiscaviarum]
MARFVDPYDEDVVVLRDGDTVALNFGDILTKTRTMMERIEMTPGAPVNLEAVIAPETVVELIYAGFGPAMVEHMATVAADIVAHRYPDYAPGVFNWDLCGVDPFEHVVVSTPDQQRYAQLALAQQILTDALNGHPSRVTERTEGLDPFAIVSLLHSTLLMYFLVVGGLAGRSEDGR